MRSKIKSKSFFFLFFQFHFIQYISTIAYWKKVNEMKKCLNKFLIIFLANNNLTLIIDIPKW